MTCAWCGRPLPADAVSDWFCGGGCQQSWHNTLAHDPEDVYSRPDALAAVEVDAIEARAVWRQSQATARPRIPRIPALVAGIIGSVIRRPNDGFKVTGI